MIVVTGPRQVGKSTLVRQALSEYRDQSNFIAVDQPLSEVDDDFSNQSPTSLTQALPGIADLTPNGWYGNGRKHGQRQRHLPKGNATSWLSTKFRKFRAGLKSSKGCGMLIVLKNLPLHVILLGSSPWLMQKGLTESLAGRYEPIGMAHWSYGEMQAAFDFSLDEYIYFGGYPGSAS